MKKLLDKKLVFVTGKGGVGKTTVAAALTVRAAQAGKRVLLCEIDTDGGAGRLFGGQPLRFAPTQVAPGIWGANLTKVDSMRAFVHRFVPAAKVADLILRNKVASIFFESAPSVMEAVIVDQIATLAQSRDPAFDLIVVDLPASGHAATFLNVPRAMVEMVRGGNLATHMRALADMVADPNRSELLLVTLPEEMPVNETVEFWARARAEIATPVRTIVVNGERLPDLHAADEDALLALGSQLSGPARAAVDRVLGGVQLGRFWGTEDRRNIERLASETGARLVQVPFVFAKRDERDLVNLVAAHLGEIP